MKTSEVYKKGIKKFQKFHNEMFDIKFKGEGVDKTYYDMKRFIKTHTLNILKVDIKRLEGEKCNIPPRPRHTRDINKLLKYAGRFNYNKAIQDQIDYYQEQIKEIDKTL